MQRCSRGGVCVVVIRIELERGSSDGAAAEAVYIEMYGPLVELATFLTGSRVTADEVVLGAYTARGRRHSIRATSAI